MNTEPKFILSNDLIRQEITQEFEHPAEMVRRWINDGKTIVLWSNQEIGSSRGDQITGEANYPDDTKKKPHWAYAFKEILSVDDIAVEIKKRVSLIPSDYPVCDRCNGTGLRSVTELAKIRYQSVETVRAMLQRKECWNSELVDDEHFQCNQCHHTGHKVEPLKLRMKRHFWGGTSLTDTGHKQARKLASRLAKHHGLDSVEYDYQYVGYGYDYSTLWTVHPGFMEIISAIKTEAKYRKEQQS